MFEITSKDLIKAAAATGLGMGVGNAAQQTGGTDTCTCPSCGAQALHPRGVPCTSFKCPSCGSLMTGVSLSQSGKNTDASVPGVSELDENDLIGDILEAPEKKPEEEHKKAASIDFWMGVASAYRS